MDNQNIQHQIQALVEQERQLRESLGSEEDREAGQAELRHVEEQLDQCWDLLRQRRAKQHAGDDPEDASARPVNQVEGYRQ
ncbi:DUF2630 family protein [Arthrobacter castelli]|uniref:DUF2630 family protein n=1 Tax=Arthrobacter castelli TaxID=271431 RepID=UPI000415E726|nr:DUF2630 family protein [Arthrobacter castelli]